MTDQQRDLEPGIQIDLSGRLGYAGYLCLDDLLALQQPRSDPPRHDELLFIVQHQVAELWMKLMIHELRAAMAALRADRLDPAQKIFARIKRVQAQLFEQWSVLETLTPADYLGFREVLGAASGFQSLQYRQLEFMLGNKHLPMLEWFAHDDAAHATLSEALAAPSLYDEALRLLARRGHALPPACVERDWSAPYQRQPGLLLVLKRIYESPDQYWNEYALCEQLVDIEENFQLWRFRHMKTVERIIGHRRGTGGSSGVAFLKRALDLSFFPELLEVRTMLGSAD